ncbi:MAG: carboxymuconolactone decarboxylase family protein, partial [bacterium]
MGGKPMEVVKLVKPGEASVEVEQIYQEICRMKDPRWLGPLFGFFANVPPLLKAWWELQKQLEVLDGHVSRELTNKIAMVCAVATDCPRCVNFHKSDLIDRLQLSAAEVDKLHDFEGSDLPEGEKAVYRVARKLTLNEGITDAEFQALRDAGYDDAGITEIVSVSLLEGGFARHAAVFARFEDGVNWP